jgi:2,3-bisphosphoglycerate-independent phosphoglycerate mutase
LKYVVILGDGMADYPIKELGGATPLQCAKKPTLDSLAKQGSLGLVKTVPEGMSPGSDTANLSVMGYDPHRYYSGRSPFEAASMGVDLKETDITFRCNLVTLSAEASYEDKVMLDHSAGEITSREGAELIRGIDERWGQKNIVFYPGISYRHLMVWHEGPYRWSLTPPHDILGKKVGAYMPAGEKSEIISLMMQESTSFLENHPVNQRRAERGLGLANSLWIWGEGKKPLLPSFSHKYGLKGSVISAVDLIKGIGICAGLEIIEVPGATGNLDTNFQGKAEYALKALRSGQDFVYIHLEAPDECSHRNELENKIKSIELIDEQVIKVVKEGLDLQGEDYRLMILPDHYTPVSLRTHTDDPVPFLIYDSHQLEENPHQAFDEKHAQEAGIYLSEGYRLMDHFLQQV